MFLKRTVLLVFSRLIEEWDVEKNEGITPDVYSARNNKKYGGNVKMVILG